MTTRLQQSSQRTRSTRKRALWRQHHERWIMCLWRRANRSSL